MIEPVELKDFFVAFFSAAMVIVFGALYAMLFAWSRIRQIPLLMTLAYGSYAILALSVFFLANATNLNGYWQSLVYVMLLGYLLAPQGIWYLCVATHQGGEVDDRGDLNERTSGHQINNARHTEEL